MHVHPKKKIKIEVKVRFFLVVDGKGGTESPFYIHGENNIVPNCTTPVITNPGNEHLCSVGCYAVFF